MENYWITMGKTPRKLIVLCPQNSDTPPEDPIIYFVFTLPDSSESDEELAKIEKEFHNVLNVIGHKRASNVGGGKEWFVTNFNTIRTIGGLLRLHKYKDFEEDQQQSDHEN